MKIGTKSVLFGAHQFMIHPWFVALAWWKLYGFPWDPRLWVAFFVHDIGYLGCPNMDGPEGEWHVAMGAQIMGALFDNDHLMTPWYCKPCTWIFNLILGPCKYRSTWYCFSFYHSRFIAKKYGLPVSKLCIADKLSFCYTPRWIYLPMVNWSGEIHEYMSLAEKKEAELDPKYASMNISTEDQIQWYADVDCYLYNWVQEHKDGNEDTWTPDTKEATTKSGVWK